MDLCTFIRFFEKTTWYHQHSCTPHQYTKKKRRRHAVMCREDPTRADRAILSSAQAGNLEIPRVGSVWRLHFIRIKENGDLGLWKIYR